MFRINRINGLTRGPCNNNTSIISVANTEINFTNIETLNTIKNFDSSLLNNSRQLQSTQQHTISSNPENITIFILNTHGLMRNKLFINSLLNIYDIIILTETWIMDGDCID
jgi:hypothetical protein